jgi:XTP/dITP diphosphohydrolase
MRIVLATRNAHKAEEIRRMAPSWIEILTLDDIGWTTPIDEPYDTFEENARAKAETIFNACGIPALADDSGLEVDALSGRPGVRSARYAGDDQHDRRNLEKVVDELAGCTNRRARFRAVLAFCATPGYAELFQGTVEGHIAETSRGAGGFGYDPVFVPEGFDQTFGELGPEVKNRISHRAKALHAFVGYLYGAFPAPAR